MNSNKVYSTKAEKYASYRWDYSPAAIETIFRLAQISSRSTMADLGAGTGILTKHFEGKVRQIFAIEPNLELRQFLTKALGTSPAVTVLDSTAENTGLPPTAVDLITVAQAIHWFEPEPTRQEMRRILKPEGWLALLRNYGTGQPEKSQSIGHLMAADYGADFTVVNQRPAGKFPRYYFGHDDYRRYTFPFVFSQTWEEFIGSLTSASYMPDEDNPLFPRLEIKAREIFDLYSEDGSWLVEGETELIIGQPSR